MVKVRKRQARKCAACGRRMRKNGFSPAHVQRWRCDRCKASSVARRVDETRKAEFRSFIEWIRSPESLARFAASRKVSRRSLLRHFSWCWNVAPSLPGPVGTYVNAEVDGTYFKTSGWCLLVAIDGISGIPLAFQWCDRESVFSYQALFAQFRKPPLSVTCDGNRGCLAALAHSWPITRVQRCLVHVHRNNRVDLTSHPKTDAGRELLRLSKRLSKSVRDEETAALWLTDLNAWHSTYASFIKQRALARNDPLNPKARTRQWWYTHERVRRSYWRLIHLKDQGSLFTFLNPELTAKGRIPPTTNRLEGGVNSVLKHALVNHRGMRPDHLRRLMEWHLILRAGQEPLSFLNPSAWQKPKHSAPINPADESIPGYGTGIQENHDPNQEYIPAEPGLHIHKGWAGHSH